MSRQTKDVNLGQTLELSPGVTPAMTLEMTLGMTLGLTGGGTAGHVWPHFALFDDPQSPLAKKVSEGRLKVVYFGSHEGMERDIVSASAPHWRYVPISTGKLRRYFSWRNFTDPFRIVAGFAQAFVALRKSGVSAVFSKGGFVSAPVVWAAWLLRIPVVIHESDVTPALATKLTLPFAFKGLSAFEETVALCPAMYRSRMQALGLPLRHSLFTATRAEADDFFGFPSGRKTLLIFGGSLGAEGLNRRIQPVIQSLCERFNVIHLVGKGKSFPVESASAYRQFEFLRDEMRLAYAVADLAICRAGASSIFELAAARIPMILIPLGLHQSRGDQIVNARIFAKHGWAEWLAEEDLTPERILASVTQAMSEIEVRKNALNQAPSPQAANQVSQLLLDLMARHMVSHHD